MHKKWHTWGEQGFIIPCGGTIPFVRVGNIKSVDGMFKQTKEGVS